jgi:putative transposase
MGKKHFTKEQIAFALRQAESGTSVAEIIRRLGISEQTFYRWKKRFAGLGIAELRRLRILEEENRKLKQPCPRPEPRQEDAAGRALKKTVGPAVQRALVREMQVAYRPTERRTCRVLGFSRTTNRYRSRRNPRAKLRVRLRDLAAPISPARGPPTDWGELVQAHDDRDLFQSSPDELPAIDIHSL